MARSKSVATVPKGQALATIDQELALMTEAIKDQIGQPTGNKISANADGTFSLPDGTNIGDEFQCVIIDFVAKNQWYDSPFVKGDSTPPACYAIGRKLAELAPEEDSPSPQSDKCATCALNQWGSSANGKGKACANRRVAAVLVIDPDNPEMIDNPAEPIYILDLPPTAVKSFDSVVGYVARALNKPPVGAIVSVNGKAMGTYSSITLTDPVPNPHYAQHFARVNECQPLLFRKPDFSVLDAPAKSKPRRGAAPPARRSAGTRR